MKIEAIDIFGATALAALAGVAIAGAVKRKREQDKIKSIISGIGETTATGNTKTTIREAWKDKSEFGYVIFKDIEYPTESQVWRIDYYDRSDRMYVLYNCADVNRTKAVKGDKVCFTGFYF